MLWNPSILKAWIFPVWKFIAAFPEYQAWHQLFFRYATDAGRFSRKCILPLASCKALEGCRMTQCPTPSCWCSCHKWPAGKTMLESSLSTKLSRERWGGLATGVCHCDQTYKLPGFLTAISRYLNGVEGTARHSCCYLAYVMKGWGVRLPTL